MVALEVWYDQDRHGELGQDDPATVVTSVEELDALVDRVLAENADESVPSMIQVAVADAPQQGAVQVGLAADVGFIAGLFNDGSAGTSRGSATGEEKRVYDYMGHAREVPVRAEIPLDQLREGLREFLTGGGQRPSNIAFE